MSNPYPCLSLTLCRMHSLQVIPFQELSGKHGKVSVTNSDIFCCAKGASRLQPPLQKQEYIELSELL